MFYFALGIRAAHESETVKKCCGSILCTQKPLVCVGLWMWRNVCECVYVVCVCMSYNNTSLSLWRSELLEPSCINKKITVQTSYYFKGASMHCLHALLNGMHLFYGHHFFSHEEWQSHQRMTDMIISCIPWAIAAHFADIHCRCALKWTCWSGCVDSLSAWL